MLPTNYHGRVVSDKKIFMFYYINLNNIFDLRGSAIFDQRPFLNKFGKVSLGDNIYQLSSICLVVSDKKIFLMFSLYM